MADESDDHALMRRMASGDRDALGALYDLHAGKVLGVALAILKNRTAAEDLVQDIFLEAWRRAHSYDPKRASARSWLLMMTRSRCIDRIRSSRVAKRAPAPVEDQLERQTAATPPVKGDTFRVAEWVEELAAGEREVLTLAYYGGLSSSEIAERLDIPIGTVKSRTARALRALREHVGGT